jgi:hypothetical protein
MVRTFSFQEDCDNAPPEPATQRLPALEAVMRRIGLRGLFGAMGLALLFAALRWNNYDTPLIRDEGEYAYAAQLLQHGLMPYQHSFLQKPPMVAYSYALASAAAPQVFWAPRVLAYVFAAMATALLGLIARKEFGPGVALPAMWLVTPMLLLPGLEQFTANTEMFMILPLMGVVAVYSLGRHYREGLWPWGLAGFLGAVTLCYKYTALPPLLWLFGAWSWQEWRAARSARLLGRKWMAGFLGALAAAALTVGYLIAVGAGSQLWECTVRFNRAYAATESFSFGALWERLQSFGTWWWILFLWPLALLKSRPAGLGVWLGLFGAAWLATSLSCYGQYYIVIMPFWALLAAVAIVSCSTWAATRMNCPPTWLRVGFTGVTLVLVCRPDVPWLVLNHQQFATSRLGPWEAPFRESPAVAQRVAAMSSPDDYVYVAGTEPQVLCYARRLSPSRFINAYPLLMPTSLSRYYQREAIAELEQHPPALIVFSRQPSSWLGDATSPPEFLDYLGSLLAHHYRMVGGYVLQGRGSHWQEPLSTQEFGQASLVLFQRLPEETEPKRVEKAPDLSARHG